MKREDIERIGRMHYQATLDHKLIMPPSYDFPDINYEDAYAIASVMVEEYVKNGRHPSGKKVGTDQQRHAKAGRNRGAGLWNYFSGRLL